MLIVDNQLEIHPILGDIEEDDGYSIICGEGDLEGWSVFNNRTGGIWHDHTVLSEAILLATKE